MICTLDIIGAWQRFLVS